MSYTEGQFHKTCVVNYKTYCEWRCIEIVVFKFWACISTIAAEDTAKCPVLLLDGMHSAPGYNRKRTYRVPDFVVYLAEVLLNEEGEQGEQAFSFEIYIL